MIGFAAETENAVHNAKSKLKQKKLDLIVANEISKDNPAFATEQNRVVLIAKRGAPKILPVLSKTEIASEIVDWIEKNLA